MYPKTAVRLTGAGNTGPAQHRLADPQHPTEHRLNAPGGAPVVGPPSAADAAAAQAAIVKLEAEHAEELSATVARLEKEKKEAVARATTLSRLSGLIDSIKGDKTESAQILKDELVELRERHRGPREENQTEAWFLDRAAALRAEHVARLEEAAKTGDLSVLPDVGAGNGPGKVDGFDGNRYVLSAFNAARTLGDKFDFERKENFSIEHEAIKGYLAEHPTARRLFQQEMSRCGPKGRVIPVPMKVLNGLPSTMLAETYGADAGTRREPTYRRDALVPFFRPPNIMEWLGVPTVMIDNDITLPRLSGSVTASWETETATVADSSLTVVEATSSPKRLACRDDVAWMLLAAANSQFGHMPVITSEMGRAAMQAREAAIYSGSGSSGQPSGVLNDSGRNTPTIAGTLPTYKELLEFEVAIANQNIPTGMARWALNPTTKIELLNILRFGNQTYGAEWNSPAWRQSDAPIGDIGSWDSFSRGTLVGMPGAVTTHLPNNVGTGSVQSDIILGIWMYVWDIVYSMAFLTIDDVSLAASAQTRVTLNLFCDVHVRYNKAFSTARETF